MGGARLASVVENIDELEKYQNKVQDKEEWVQMADEEHWLEDLIQTLRSKVASAPDIQDALRDAIQSKLDEAESISADCGVRQALGALAQMLLALMNAAGSEEESVWIVEHLIVGRPGLKLFEPIKAEKGPPTSSPGPEPSPGGGSPGASKGGKPLGEERPALGVDGPAAEQPQQAEERFDYDEHGLIRARKSERLEKLHDILTKIQRNFEDGPTDQVGTFRGIVFVKSRQSACEILDWIKNHAGLNAFFKPSPFVGQVCMTIQDQYDATVRFHSGECNLLVATSVAEEGLDFPACNIVVRYSSASSHTALIQSRGRVRAGQGEMYILTRRPDSRESVSFRKSQRFEKFAKEAAAKLSVQ
ncbi:P-loop containing nucleoside triphosphate hydrolase protein [Baffinella frigidus]|nr:P-loop containing nucleoside triphosphate hydrolase protein [Cryptophyta sp. CCMP2293]